MSEFQLIVFVVFAFVATIVVAWKDGENKRLRDENRKLREWQGEQAKTPELGAHRTARTFSTMTITHVDGKPLRNVNCNAVLGVDRCDCSPPCAPEPTSIPSNGRTVES